MLCLRHGRTLIPKYLLYKPTEHATSIAQTRFFFYHYFLFIFLDIAGFIISMSLLSTTYWKDKFQRARVRTKVTVIDPLVISCPFSRTASVDWGSLRMPVLYSYDDPCRTSEFFETVHFPELSNVLSCQTKAKKKSLLPPPTSFSMKGIKERSLVNNGLVPKTTLAKNGKASQQQRRQARRKPVNRTEVPVEQQIKFVLASRGKTLNEMWTSDRCHPWNSY